MINSSSDYHLFYKSLRSFIYFKLRFFLNFFYNGHLIRKYKITTYLNNDEFKKKKITSVSFL